MFRTVIEVASLAILQQSFVLCRAWSLAAQPYNPRCDIFRSTDEMRLNPFLHPNCDTLYLFMLRDATGRSNKSGLTHVSVVRSVDTRAASTSLVRNATSTPFRGPQTWSAASLSESHHHDRQRACCLQLAFCEDARASLVRCRAYPEVRSHKMLSMGYISLHVVALNGRYHSSSTSQDKSAIHNTSCQLFCAPIYHIKQPQLIIPIRYHARLEGLYR